MERSLRKTRVGLVVSDKMDKTVVVAVQEHYRHPVYKKVMRSTYKLKAQTKTTNAASATKFSLWKRDLCPRKRDGVSLRSLKRRNNKACRLRQTLNNSVCAR